jgi:GT2 family glycosyltransferase
MSTESSPATESRPTGRAITAIVVGSDAELVGPCLAAVGRQVYGPSQVIVVGGDDAVRRVAGDHEALWRASMSGAIDALAADVEFAWVLDERARPLPDALGALVIDGGRADASIAGSKIIRDDEPDRFVSVGFATDVFAAPYTGLQPDEVDQEQYDVIRDVAAVSATSMLIRRDLLLGLGGLDASMAPTSASVDLCQRARLRGGRVVVVPSSEVRYAGPDPTPEWRERAGEIRAMLKVYSPVTLLWAIPLVMVIGVAESVTAPFLGRWKLFSVLFSWAWNLVMLPSTITRRLRARRGRVVGDEELFRYQVNGSARLRLAYDDGLERLRTRFPDGVLSGFSDVVEAGQQRFRRPAFVLALLTLVVGYLATRSIWSGGLPASGYSLPPPGSAGDALAAYAGGWNPAGLGSPEVLRPFVAAVAIVQRVLFDSPGLAMAVLLFGSFVGGVFGMARLMRVWGFDPLSGYGGGLLLVAGPAVLHAGGDGHWVVLVAVAALPWAVSGALRPFPKEWPQRVARIASITLATGIVGLFVPGAMVLPTLLVLLWAGLGSGHRWWAALRSAGGLVLALPLLVPWVLFADAGDYLRGGIDAFWNPGWLLVAIAAAVVFAPLVSGDRTVAYVAGWGGIAVAGGVLLARSGDLGVGRDGLLIGLVAAAFGIGVAGGAALEFGARRTSVGGPRLMVGLGGVAATLLLVGATVVVIAPGRAGLPADEFGEMFAFAATADEPARVLVFGADDRLPGTTRDLEGLAYRVVDPPVPESWSTFLASPRLGDEALHGVLTEVLDGEVRRAGERLAPFGIGWVAFVDESPMEVLFETQLDLVPLRSFSFTVFRNEVASPVAVDDGGAVWRFAGTGFAAPDGGGGSAVGIAVNADARWGPGAWSQIDWANRVESGGSDVVFESDGGRRTQALLAGGWFLVLLALVAVGRWEGRG